MDPNFSDGAPRTIKEWHDMGYTMIPCNPEGVPLVKGWADDGYDSRVSTIPEDYFLRKKILGVLGLRLKDKVDYDIDNPIMQKFIAGRIVCGAKFGRQSNPLSHLLFEGTTKNEEVIVPAAFEKYFKHFPHGRRLLDIRSGQDHFTYVPGGLRPHKKNMGSEVLEWLNFTGFMKYDTRTNAIMKEICLQTALSVMFPATGQRDNYISSIAGILAKHTDWSDEKINTFCFDLAFKSGSDNPSRYASKGTDARKPDNKHFGIPKLAEVLEVTPADVSKLFGWVGVKDASSMFSDLVVYNTDPKQWRLKFKDKWIDIWDTSILLSYTKVKVLILETCMEEPPEVLPKDWKVIRMQLLQNVKKEDAPPDSSYYGVIASNITLFLQRRKSIQMNRETLLNTPPEEDRRFNLADNIGCAFADEHYWVKTEAIINELKRDRLSLDVRKIAHLLRTEFKAEQTKVTIEKKEIRCWKIPKEMVEGSRYSNNDGEALKKGHEKFVKAFEEKYGHGIYQKKSNY
jgi:hypothetical protein